jgi:hypothetical protein
MRLYYIGAGGERILPLPILRNWFRTSEAESK